jgi:hypothetical protein
MHTSIIIGTLLLLVQVSAEGYICPYADLGFDGENKLLYDYYDTKDGGSYYTRKGETGWQSVKDYCYQKGDLSLHTDAGEWKCNDSKGICGWTGSSCAVKSEQANCKALCKAVIDGKGPACLGNCPGGRQSNTLYERYCNADGSSIGGDNSVPSGTCRQRKLLRMKKKNM